MPDRGQSGGGAGGTRDFYSQGGRLRPAEPTDEAFIKRLLELSELPHEDIRRHLRTFVVAELGGSPVGVGGLEPRGSAGLLRSLAVATELQGQGIGKSLCDRIIADARCIGIEKLYLLTTNAKHFFARLGFVPVDRARVPASVRKTVEFRILCPASAICMERPLEQTSQSDGGSHSAA